MLTHSVVQLILLVGFQNPPPPLPPGVDELFCRDRFGDDEGDFTFKATSRIFQNGKLFNVQFDYETEVGPQPNGKYPRRIRFWYRDKHDGNHLMECAHQVPVDTGRVVPIFGELHLCSEMPAGWILFRVTHLVPEDYRPTQDRFCASQNDRRSFVDPFEVSRISTPTSGSLTASFQFDVFLPENDKWALDTREYRVAHLVEIQGGRTLYRPTRIVKPRTLKLAGFDNKEFLDHYFYFPLPRHREFVSRGWVEFDPLPVSKK